MGAMVERKGERKGYTDGEREKERRKVKETSKTDGVSKINRMIDEVWIKEEEMKKNWKK